MTRPHFDYGVVILNYNVALDAIAAAKSINENALGATFRICIVDNNSSKKEDSELLNNSNVPNCDILLLLDNGGYSRGNNAGIRFLLDHYDVDFLVIMNPDVLLIQKGTIDLSINRLRELDNSFCGIQPLNWTPCFGDPRYQVQARMVPTYKNMIFNHFGPLNKLFPRIQKDFFYLEAMPYEKEFEYFVPSGAFFIIRTEVFKDISFFDERTFLYNEEYILGNKIKLLNKKFMLKPDIMVMHEGGKSISAHSKRKTWTSVMFEMESTDVYLKYYLDCGFVKRYFIHMLIYLDYAYRCIKDFIK